MISMRIGAAHADALLIKTPAVILGLGLRNQPGRAHRTCGGRWLLIRRLGYQALFVCGFFQDDTANIVTAVRTELHPELRRRVGR